MVRPIKRHGGLHASATHPSGTNDEDTNTESFLSYAARDGTMDWLTNEAFLLRMALLWRALVVTA
jgi:hypothetical protein